ncbi:DEAD/DEAH box helicase [Mycobacterium sp. KBS0706]|uniref:DEAD/DEAH box helicase n=1 Tax=Mycobacterium sp. KBS0706 TaxID=2578109 RepID=UPI00110FEB86|nr:DEAD/DEAH box helicase [Mycobacterium sp. KBS0706]TSD89942.1 DEAD/DEAH box helicase [Mycobacterium sp. KBS0706]
MSLSFGFACDAEGCTLSVIQPKRGLLSFLSSRRQHNLEALPREQREVAMALARLRVLDRDRREHTIAGDTVRLSHRLVAELDNSTARVLGLPPPVSRYIFKAAMKGSIGGPDFRLDWWWETGGRKVPLRRIGPVVEDASGFLRLPSPIWQAIEIAEAFDAQAPLQDHWLALGKFRRALGIEALDDAGSIGVEGALKQIEIVTCDSVGLALDPEGDSLFAPLPFVGAQLPQDVQADASKSSLQGEELAAFQRQAAARKAQPAYRVGPAKFLILDRSAMPVIDVIAEAAARDAEGRRHFIRDAERVIAEAIERQALEDGRLNELMSPEGYQEALEREIARSWTETSEWSSRVIAIAEWARPTPAQISGSGTTWLPATMTPELGELLGALRDEEVEPLLLDLAEAKVAVAETLIHRVGSIPVIDEVIEALARRLEMLRRRAEAPEAGDPQAVFLPLTHSNFWDQDFCAKVKTRGEREPVSLPSAVATELRPYQFAAFEWQVSAWQAGLPGILNADEQGLGKTLQTLSFLTWLAERMQAGRFAPRPLLIVAPTSLLRNWEAECAAHMHAGFWDEPVRLYGQHLQAWKAPGRPGRDIDDGTARLDLGPVENAPRLVITTYQTLANYAVTFSQTRFAVAVFDEIQNLKNPIAMRSEAAKAVDADFRIGLTGTPVENATRDIWAVMDQLFPGALGPLAEFRRVFDEPREERMRQLHAAIFTGQLGHPPLGLRRLKKDVAPELPPKARILHPRIMPEVQAMRYDEIRGRGGGMFALLHHIRRISLHPGLVEGEVPKTFTSSSARLDAAMDILAAIKAKGERALVFVENRDVQAWFAELIKIEFGLDRVYVINGGTPIDARKEITDRFQRHLVDDGGFDVLVMGPRAAGTGLTLTAANHVIHLTRWWNPAVEEQCNDRTHRIGQSQPVTIHIPLAVHPRLGPNSFDCLLQRLMNRKRGIADAVLWPQETDGGPELLELYQAVIDGPEEASPDTSVLPMANRPDLRMTEVRPGILRAEVKGGGGSILVVHGVDPDLAVGIARASDKAIISMAAPVMRPEKTDIPLSALPDLSLWPDYILPS